MNFLRYILRPIMIILHKVWLKKNREHNARFWSNDCLKEYAAHFKGDIVNVSGGDDRDKESSYYKNYFSKASSYSITNYVKESDNDIALNLSDTLEKDSPLYNKYDVVFSHTVLEHVYDVQSAFNNLCHLSKDVVISVVPFLQTYHSRTEFSDYWRFSPHTLVHLFKERGFETIHLDWNNDPFGNIYIFHIASKNPEKWDMINTYKKTSNKLVPGSSRQNFLNHRKENAGESFEKLSTLNELQ